MRTSSSPPVLYLTGDEEDDIEPIQMFPSGSITATSSATSSLPRKKRKLTNANVRINPSIVNWSKRYRSDHHNHQHQNHHHHHHNSQPYYPHPILPKHVDPDPEPILLDPDEYIVEEPEPQSFRAFDWTLEPRPILPSPMHVPSYPIQLISQATLMPVPNVIPHHLQKPDSISLLPLNDRNIPSMSQQRKPIAIPVPLSPPTLPPPPPPQALLPLPKPTSLFTRPRTKRGRPTRTRPSSSSRSTDPSVSFPTPVRHGSERIFPHPATRRSAPATVISTPPSSSSTTNHTNNPAPEIRRPVLGGTGIFSAFHDASFYRCNICKFKSVTSSILLQHLFTHMLFCQQCSYYTYSRYAFYEHMFEQHQCTFLEQDDNDEIDCCDPEKFNLLYVTRCSDGTFALCMDSSSSPSSSSSSSSLKTTNKNSNNENNEERLVLSSSSAVVNERHQVRSHKKKVQQPKQPKPIKPIEEENDIVVLSSKIEPKTTTQSHIRTLPIREKQGRAYVLMKHRRFYAAKNPTCLHSLSLEYNICREHTIRHMCETLKLSKRRRRKSIIKTNQTLLIDSVASCLRYIVNCVVDIEENSVSPLFTRTLPTCVLEQIVPANELNKLSNSLNLINKHELRVEQDDITEAERWLRTSPGHLFVLSASEASKSAQSFFLASSASLTNGTSPFLQTKLDKLPAIYDTTYRFIKQNEINHSRPTNFAHRNPEVNNTNQLSSAISKLSKSVPVLTTTTNKSSPTSVDKNNNSVVSSKSQTSAQIPPPPRSLSPGVIILD